MREWGFIDEELTRLRELHQLRSLRCVGLGGSHHLQYEGRTLLNFSSNDYLGLADRPEVKRAAQDAIERYQAGPGASRLICGNLDIHEQLECEIARFKNRESALLFSSGYMTNLGILTALADGEDQIFSDALNHASIVDGCRLSRARTFVYRHKDSNHLEMLLCCAPTCRRKLIVSDAVFSMDGDVAELPDLLQLSEKYDALLVIDEAHSTGVLGRNGRGIEELFLEQKRIAPNGCRIDLIMGTLSKALGSFGGFVACSAALREWLVNKARTLIFSTALPASAAGAALASLALIQETNSLQETLWRNQRLFRDSLRMSHFDIGGSVTPIVPVIFGSDQSAVTVSERLIECGYFVPAIRPPTVPQGSSRLRVTLSAAHSANEVEGLAQAIIKCAAESASGSGQRLKSTAVRGAETE